MIDFARMQLVLSAIVAIAAAAPAPGYYHAAAPLVTVAVQPEYAHVGSIVKHIPTAVSHQSRTDYHSTPVIKSVLAPVEYVQPIVHHAPAISVHHAPIVHAAPLLHAAPLVHAW